MDGQTPGYVISLSEISGRQGLAGHPGVTAYSFARPDRNSRWLLVTLDVVEEGGGIDLHYHDGMDFDHAYYVIDGEVVASIGDRQYRIGSDSLMFFPCGVAHGFKVVSAGGARILRLGASPDGVATGNSVWMSTAGNNLAGQDASETAGRSVEPRD